MSDVGHLVTRFPETKGKDGQGDRAVAPGAEQMESSSISTATGPSTAPAGATGAPMAPPGSKGARLPKPAPPGRKPTKPPPGVAMRKQRPEEKPQQQQKEAPSNIRRQNSTSFTTEDLDLFQRPRHLDEHVPEAGEEKADSDIRRSRRDSIKRSDGQSEKRRSKSVGAFAHGGLSVSQPLNDKPTPPSKPKIATKPLVGRPIPSSKPAKPQKPSTTDAAEPELPPKKTPVVLRHPKSTADGQRPGSGRSSRPASGTTRPTSLSKSSSASSSRPASGSTRPPSHRHGFISKTPSSDDPSPTDASKTKTNVRLRSPVKTPTKAGGNTADSTVSGSSRHSRSSGHVSRTPSYIPACATSEKSAKATEPKAPPRRGSNKGGSAATHRSSSMKNKSSEKSSQKAVKQDSVETAETVPTVNQLRKQFGESKQSHVGKPSKVVPPKPVDKKALKPTDEAAESQRSGSPRHGSPLPAPKISPKPVLLRNSPSHSPVPPAISPKPSPFHSPVISPAVSPKPSRAKFSTVTLPTSTGASPGKIESKEAARATILSALAAIPGRPSSITDGITNVKGHSEGGQDKSEVSTTEVTPQSANQSLSDKKDSNELSKISQIDQSNNNEVNRSDSDNAKSAESDRKRSIGNEVKNNEPQFPSLDAQAVVKESLDEPKAGRETHIHEKDFEHTDDVEEALESQKTTELVVPPEVIASNGSVNKPRHHHESGKDIIERCDEGSLNKAVAKAAVEKVFNSYRKPAVKPPGPPPSPPAKPASQKSKPNSPTNSPGGSPDASLADLTEAPIYESPSGSPASSRSKQLKTGLDAKGKDLPVAQLIRELREVEITTPLKRQSGGSGVTNAKGSPLPIRLYNKDGSPGSSDSERKDQPQSDSNDADDEDEATVNDSKRHKHQLFVKSFSTGQGDIEPNLSLVGTEKRPVSITSTVSSEATVSSEGSGNSETKSNKSKKLGVFERLRKLSLGLISSENGEEDQASEKVGNAVFYRENESSDSSASTKRNTILVGKTKFYRGDSSSIDEENQSDGNHLYETIDLSHERNNRNPDLGERPPLLPERSLERNKSKDDTSGELFVENENYESAQPYENIMFGPIYEGIEVQKNKAGRNDLCSSSQSSLEQQPSDEGAASMENNDQDKVSPTTPSPPEENANVETMQPQQQQQPEQDDANTTADNEPIYHDVNVLKTELNNAGVYENVEFGERSNAKRSIWRRKTLRRKTKKRPREPETKENATGDGEAPLEGPFEDFSDSDDSFTSDSFTDESGGEEKQGVTLYAPLERPKPVEQESDVTPMSKLKRIATELLTTEKHYVQRLHLIDQVFHFRVVIENRAHHMFPDDVIPQMFPNIKSVYQFHHDFLLPQLEKRMAEWDTTPKIGDLMKKFAPFLKLYSEYVKNFDHAMNTITTWTERSQQFANILSELQKKEECGNLTLQHHMLEPIQRVPRYELLLKDYLKHLPEGSDDEADTKGALQLVTTAASHSNEAMRKIEKFRKLLELNEKFGGTVDLIDPTRELIKEGKITKISARNGLHFERYIFLFSDMLLLCQTHVMGLIHSYRIKNLLEIEGMQVLESDNLETPYTFLIKSKIKTIEVHTSTAAEKVEWFVSIDNVIADYTRKQMSRQAGRKVLEAFQEKQLGNRAPTWVKDQNTSMCMECGSPFSMIKRRHHCRCCGIVVCNKCSSHKAPLPYLGGKSDRVCGKCFRTLSGRGEQTLPISSHIVRKKGVLQVKGSDPSVVAGMLLMSCDKKSWEKRWFALHGNFVLYSFKAPQDVHAMTSLPLPGYEAEAVTKEEHLDKENVIKLFHHNQKKAYYFSPEGNNSARWLLSLEYATKAELPPDYEPPSSQ